MALEFIKPTYSPVKSVNGMTGDVVIEMPEVPEIDLTGYATEEYVDRKVLEVQAGDVNLDAYATKVYVDEVVAAIELTPGPIGPKGEDGKTPVKDIDYFDGKDGVDGYTPIKGIDYFDGKDGKDGAPGVDGKDYILTEEDKAEIAGMVPGADVDLTDYYTKSEIDSLLANLPAGGDLPSGEEVEF